MEVDTTTRLRRNNKCCGHSSRYRGAYLFIFRAQDMTMNGTNWNCRARLFFRYLHTGFIKPLVQIFAMQKWGKNRHLSLFSDELMCYYFNTNIACVNIKTTIYIVYLGGGGGGGIRYKIR